MKRLSFVVLLVFVIGCSTVNAFAAQMKYSFEFYIGAAFLDGNPLDPMTIATINLYGDTENIEPNPGSDLMFAYSDLSADLILHGIGQFDFLFGERWFISLMQHYDGGGIINLGCFSRTVGHISIDGPTVVSLYEEQNFTTIANSWWNPYPYYLDTSGGTLNWQFTTDGSDIISYQSRLVPIPSAIWLLGSAFIGLVGFRKFRRKE